MSDQGAAPTGLALPQQGPLFQQSPPVKLQLNPPPSKPLQHLQSPLVRQQQAGNLGAEAQHATPHSSSSSSGPSVLRRETVEVDPLLISDDNIIGSAPPGKPGGTSGFPLFPPPQQQQQLQLPLPIPLPGKLPSAVPTPPSAPPPLPLANQKFSPQPGSVQQYNGTRASSPQTTSPVGEQQISPTSPASSSFQEDTAKFLSQCRTIPLDPSTVQPTLAGLKTFAQASAWKHVVELSDKLLSEPGGAMLPLGQDGLSYAMRIRLEGLFRMKMFDELNHEVSKILESEAERLVQAKAQAQGKETGKSLDLTTALRLLLVEILSLTGRGEEALTQLHILKHWLLTTAENVNVPYWLWKTSGLIVNCTIRLRNWRAAVQELTNMLNVMNSTLPNRQNEKELGSVCKAQVVLLCRLARTMLQMGFIEAAVKYSERAEEALASGGLTQDEVAEHVELTKGLTLFAQNKFEQALDIFGGILSRDHGRQTSDTFDVLSAKNLQTDVNSTGLARQFPFLAGIELEESLLSVAANNFSVAALHLRKMSLSVSRLEALIQEDPVRYLTDPIVFNLCTLYELSCSPDVSTIKKKILQITATTYLVDDPVLNARSLRL